MRTDMRPSRIVRAATLLAATLAGTYLVISPSSQDLAAATFRADLFADHGFLLWNDLWYSGHYLLSYSVLFPPLGALLGVRLLAALSVVAAAALFAVLAERRFGDRAWLGALWFAAGVASWLLTGRVPFLLAVSFGLGALLAADSGRPAAAGVLAALTSLTSPVAGLFVALAGAALGLAGAPRPGGWLLLGGIAPIAALNLAFPTGGSEPFVFSAFVALPLLAVAALWLIPRRHRALRIGVVLYALLALALFVVSNPLGGNVTRLGALAAGPVMALVLWPRGRLVVAAVALPLLYWQLVAPVRDVRKAAGDPATERQYYQPLLAELDRITDGPGSARIEVPPTANRWEAAYVARDHPIARGWLRQLESEDFDLFTDGELDAASYRDWLGEHQVRYVAVPDAKLDYLAEDEVALIDSGLDYLDPVWEGDHWRLYRVVNAGQPRLTAVGPDWFELDTRRPGEYPVGIRGSSYWTVTEGDGCVSDDHGQTVVEARSPGPIRVEARLFGDPCSR
jgi:hypothetical protein